MRYIHTSLLISKGLSLSPGRRCLIRRGGREYSALIPLLKQWYQRRVLPFLGPRDSFKLAVQYGEGYGAQIKSGPDDAAFNLGSSELETIGVFSTYAGLQHWWANSVRSNLVYGYLDADNPGFIDGDELENTTYLAANLVWNPYKKITLGFEYLWGRRENKDGASGNNNRFLFSSRFDY